MYIPDGLFFDMDTSRLSPHARLLMLDCCHRACRQYPSHASDLRISRPLCVRWGEGRLGMSRPAFAKARQELCAAGFLGRHRNERTNKLQRDWFVLLARYWPQEQVPEPLVPVLRPGRYALG